jgi:hypothetical protein
MRSRRNLRSKPSAAGAPPHRPPPPPNRSLVTDPITVRPRDPTAAKRGHRAAPSLVVLSPHRLTAGKPRTAGAPPRSDEPRAQAGGCREKRGPSLWAGQALPAILAHCVKWFPARGAKACGPQSAHNRLIFFPFKTHLFNSQKLVKPSKFMEICINNIKTLSKFIWNPF